MTVEFSDKVIRFKDLKNGDIFTFSPFKDNVFVKIENCYLKVGGEFHEYNALALNDGFFRKCQMDDEVIPRTAKIVVDR